MDKDKYIEILQDVIRINSENNNEEEVARYYQKLLAKHGIESELVEFSKGRSSLVAEVTNGSGPVLALSGHMDVVSAGDLEDWSHDPFAAEIEDEVIWGRGASDMKAGLTAMVIAMIELNESKTFSGTVKLLATVGEEVGQHGAAQLTDEGYADDVDAILIGEPCNVGIMYAHKGSLNYTVTSRGVSAHSSSPQLGVNAVENLGVAIEKISDRVAEVAKSYTNDILGDVFHNITVLDGGSQVNSIPDYAAFEANARTIPEFDNQAVIAVVEEVVAELNKRDGFDLAVKVTADQPPVQADPQSRLVQTIVREVGKIDQLKPRYLVKQMGDVLGEDLEEAFMQKKSGKQLLEGNKVIPITSSGTTDAAQFMRADDQLELAVYGPGMPMLNHKIDERLPLEQYLAFIEVYKRIVEGYLSES